MAKVKLRPISLRKQMSDGKKLGTKATKKAVGRELWSTFHEFYVGMLGSAVIPKSVAVGVLGGVLALSFKELQVHFDYQMISDDSLDSDGRLYSAYSFALGFLVVWRNGHAFSRWWDGVQTLVIAMTEWMDACSQLVACTTNSKLEKDQIMAYNHVVARLFSLLTCLALKHIAVQSDEDFPVLNVEGLDAESQRILWHMDRDSGTMLSIVQQWILNTIHQGMEDGVVVAPPPIVSRIFQELANGTFHVEKLVVISSSTIPATYTAMIIASLTTHIFYTAIMASCLIEDRAYMFIVSFLSVFVLWCINLIAMEIEHPFGDDHNDIDVHHTQEEVNRHLKSLLDPFSFHRPVCGSFAIMTERMESEMFVSQVIDHSSVNVQCDSSWSHRNMRSSASRGDLGEIMQSKGSNKRTSLGRQQQKDMNNLTPSPTDRLSDLTWHGSSSCQSPAPCSDADDRDDDTVAKERWSSDDPASSGPPNENGAEPLRDEVKLKGSPEPMLLRGKGPDTKTLTSFSSDREDLDWWREMAVDVRRNTSGILEHLEQQGPRVDLLITAWAEQRQLANEVIEFGRLQLEHRAATGVQCPGALPGLQGMQEALRQGSV